MTLRALIWAKNHDADLSPIGRLALIGLADSATDEGCLWAVSAAAVQGWARRPLEECEAGIAELRAAGLLHDLGVGDMAWLPLDGWEADFEQAVWQAYKPSKKRPPLRDDLRHEVFTDDGHRCVECGSATDLSVDHKHPRSRGGTDVRQNLRTLCRPCNSRKNNRVTA